MKAHDDRRLSVLFVDDEEETCNFFRLALEPEFRVLTAHSASRALELLRAPGSRVGVVVSDQRMPGENGSEFLTRVRQEDPMTVRILTTAYSDLDAAIAGVNLGSIYKYVVKPWNLNDLRATLRQAMEYRQLRQERDLLLSERLATLQHLLVADRVRSLAVLARGLSHHIRNALTPLESHVYQAKAELEDEPPPEGDATPFLEMLKDAESVIRHLLDLVENVSAAALDPQYHFEDRTELAALLRDGLDQARGSGDPIGLQLVAPLPPVVLRCDAALMTRMFAALLRQMARIAGKDATLTVEHRGRTSVWGSPAEWLVLRSSGDWDREAVSNLLTPFAMAPYGAAQTDSDLLTAFLSYITTAGRWSSTPMPPKGRASNSSCPTTRSTSSGRRSSRACSSDFFCTRTTGGASNAAVERVTSSRACRARRARRTSAAAALRAPPCPLRRAARAGGSPA